MKSIEELQEILVFEIYQSYKVFDSSLNLTYYNEVSGNVSFLLAAVLEKKLRNNSKKWDSEKWIDDSLITKVRIKEEKVSIWGVMIWGRADTTEQWTDPFYFEISVNKNWSDFVELTFLYGEEGGDEVTYGEFDQNRNLWDRGFYSNDDWNPSERDWKYIINSKKKLV